MKSIKVFGAVLAFVAIASTASPAAAKPSALCVANEDPCAVKNIKSEWVYGYAGPTTENPTSVKLTSGLGTMSCEVAKIVLEVSTGKGEPIVAESWFILGNCLYLGSKCFGESEALRYFATIEALSKGNGLFTVGKPVLVLSCSFGECRYTALGLDGEIKGGNPAMLSVNDPLEKLSGGVQCPSTFTYVGTLEDQAELATYVTHA